MLCKNTEVLKQSMRNVLGRLNSRMGTSAKSIVDFGDAVNDVGDHGLGRADEWRNALYVSYALN